MKAGPEFLVSVSSYKGILYLENLGGDQLKEPPCTRVLKGDLYVPKIWTKVMPERPSNMAESRTYHP